jgi:hypothetical protein
MAIKLALICSMLCALAACGGTPSGCPTPLPGSQAAPLPPELFYPEPGATNVPDGNLTMVVAFATSLTLTAGAQLIALPSPGPAPSPLPSPMASPPFANDALLQGVAVPALQSHTTYSVHDQRGPAGVCNPPTDLGSFTTQ